MTRKLYPRDVTDEEWGSCSFLSDLDEKNAPQREPALQEVYNDLRWIVRAGVQWRNFIPPHLSVAYAEMQLGRDTFPISEEIADTKLSVPIGPHLSIDDVSYIVEAVQSYG